MFMQYNCIVHLLQLSSHAQHQYFNRNALSQLTFCASFVIVNIPVNDWSREWIISITQIINKLSHRTSFSPVVSCGATCNVFVAVCLFHVTSCSFCYFSIFLIFFFLHFFTFFELRFIVYWQKHPPTNCIGHNMLNFKDSHTQ